MRWGQADFRQLQQLERQIDKLERADFDKFCRKVAAELALRIKSKAYKRTPVGDYSHEIKVVAKRDSKYHKKGDVYTKRVNPSGKMGGTLRRGWSVLDVIKEGGEYRVEIFNPVMYAPYVEYGHRTANGKGWVPGHFMLTISVQEVENLMPALLEKRLYELLKGLF